MTEKPTDEKFDDDKFYVKLFTIVLKELMEKVKYTRFPKEYDGSMMRIQIVGVKHPPVILQIYNRQLIARFHVPGIDMEPDGALIFVSMKSFLGIIRSGITAIQIFAFDGYFTGEGKFVKKVFLRGDLSTDAIIFKSIIDELFKIIRGICLMKQQPGNRDEPSQGKPDDGKVADKTIDENKIQPEGDTKPSNKSQSIPQHTQANRHATFWYRGKRWYRQMPSSVLECLDNLIKEDAEITFNKIRAIHYRAFGELSTSQKDALYELLKVMSQRGTLLRTDIGTYKKATGINGDSWHQECGYIFDTKPEPIIRAKADTQVIAQSTQVSEHEPQEVPQISAEEMRKIGIIVNITSGEVGTDKEFIFNEAKTVYGMSKERVELILKELTKRDKASIRISEAQHDRRKTL